eukprot:1141360-Pelagomonas_calceolata.AAC.1
MTHQEDRQMRSSMARPSARMRPLLPSVEMKAKHARTCRSVKRIMATLLAAKAAWSSTAWVNASVTPAADAQHMTALYEAKDFGGQNWQCFSDIVEGGKSLCQPKGRKHERKCGVPYLKEQQHWINAAVQPDAARLTTATRSKALFPSCSQACINTKSCSQASTRLSLHSLLILHPNMRFLEILQPSTRPSLHALLILQPNMRLLEILQPSIHLSFNPFTFNLAAKTNAIT